ncbi:polysaccharide lyase family 8 super-sandwich domain-containing protein [Salisediminibacterium selenitireducens]|uniref:Hyaluronate lyase n=1 Tax=Bacillus selenitireducens (strain ATCC 700615 / DSM 15326 / MLS10) TaxID=439292 RepID=D6XZJ5_BACIE|nr:polysaccharide lyase family 8 super-sandwich domain-containing protein [Salisediminibacterium selenitireducens]ADH98369.1 Hyaluronate lyase [[Bacillus] selenitireducens MLS10]
MKYLQKQCVIGLVMALLFPLFIPFFESVSFADSSMQTARSGELLNNGSFEDQEHAGDFADLWTDGMKPAYWDLRNWGNSGGEPPLATHHHDEQIVTIELDQTVSFFQYQNPIPVKQDATYELTTAIRAENLSTPHTSGNAASLRVEHLNENGQVLLRDDVAHVTNTDQDTGWHDVHESVQPVQGAETIRLILITGVVSPGQGATGTIAIDSFSLSEVSKDEPPHVEDELANTLLKNHRFDETEHAESFADLWQDETKPAYWDLRNWGPSEGEAPKGHVHLEGEETIVSLSLDETVGFFQYYDAIEVDPNRRYEIGTVLRTAELNSPNPQGNAAFLRVEQFNGTSLLERKDVAAVPAGSTDWMTRTGEIETKSNATHIRLILVIGGAVSPEAGSSGTIDIKSFAISGQEAAVEGISFDDEPIYVKEGETVKATFGLTPVYAEADSFTWTTGDPTVATVDDGSITGVSAGETAVTVIVNDDLTLTDTAKVIVHDGEIPVSDITLQETDMTVVEGRSFAVFPDVHPSSSSDATLNWSVSDETVLQTDGTFVHAIAPGEAEVIIRAADSDAEARMTVSVLPYEETEFDRMRERWVNYIVPNAYTDMDTPAIADQVDELTEKAASLLATMKMDKEADVLWDDAGQFSDSATMTTHFRNLHQMAQAYTFEASSLYKSESLLEAILYGLRWMNEHHYHADGSDYGNWWDWQIGSPQLLNDTVAMVHDSLAEEQRLRYTDAVKHYIPEVTHYYGVGNATWRVKASGANLVDLGKAVALQGILAHDEERIASAQEHFPVVTIKQSGRGNGVYIDGSFIDHNNIAYTGTYGVVFLGSMIDLIYMLNDSRYELNEDDLNVIYEMIFLSFEPVIYKGLMMDMVNGRAISRGNTEDIGHGRGAVQRIIQYATIVPNHYEERMMSMIKGWLISQPEMIDAFNRIQVITMANTILNDETIEARGELIGHYLMTHMDRVAHRRPGFTFALSKYSDRIAAYEGNMNGENMKGHYTGSGMTYLYTDDLHQYNDGFWAAIDPKRLPGITANMDRPLSPGLGTARTSPATWVGGTSLDGLYGASGMQLDQAVFGQSLTGHKSWFMFDDEIVALGSGISSDDGDQIETIIDSRKLAKEGMNEILIDGAAINTGMNTSHTATEPTWMHIEGNTAGSDIGYVFPETADVHVQRYEQSGSWYDINRNGSTETVTRPFAELSVDHGTDPTDDTYAYIVLPNQSSEAVSDYAAAPDVTVLANTKEVQAAEEASLGILAANFWTDGPTTAGKLTSYNKASVMMREYPGDRLEVSVSDPTRQNNGTIELVIDHPVSAPLVLDDGVKVLAHTDENIHLSFDVKDASGLSKTAILDLQEGSSGWQTNALFDERFEDGPHGESVTSVNVSKADSLTYFHKSEAILPERDFTGVTPFAAETGTVEVTYTFTPKEEGIDAVMGLAGEEMTISNYPDLPIIVRASSNTGGLFDARDGAVFKADEELSWHVGTSYDIAISVNLDEGRYSVLVTPEDENPVQIASDFAFRDTASTPEDIGKFIFQDNRTTHASVVDNLKINGKEAGIINKYGKLESIDGEDAFTHLDVSDATDRIIVNWSFMTRETEGLTITVSDTDSAPLFTMENGMDRFVAGYWHDATLDINLLSGVYSFTLDGDVIESGSWAENAKAPARFTFGYDASSGTSDRQLFIDHFTLLETSVAITQLSAAESALHLNTGDEYLLSPVVEPAGAFTEGLRYTTDASDTVTVDHRGTVTAKQAGNAVITITDLVSGTSAQVRVSVTDLPSQQFEDVPLNHWASHYIDTLTSAGIIEGFSDYEFRPADDVTRGQMIAMLVRIGELNPSTPGETAFTDQHGTLSDAITAAYEAGITNGYEDGTFRQDESVNREEMAIMIARAIDIFTGEPLSSEHDLAYKDLEQIGQTAIPSVAALTKTGILEGTAGGHFLPHQPTKRDQTAKVLYYVKELID